MKSLLNALQEGRLIELPDADKDKSLQFLAHLIEAVPDLGGSPELAEAMMAREKAQNTGIGLGIACPHVRSPGGGELICAVGWSPAGIEYGSPDAKKVHLVVMYFIPDAQKNTYLKEVSSLAQAIHREGGIQPIATAKDIGDVRERLLDWVQAAIDASLPEAKARMIRLEARQAGAEAAAAAPTLPGAVQVVALTALSLNGDGKLVVLCQNAELASELEKDPAFAAALKSKSQYEKLGYRVVLQSSTPFPGERVRYDLLAVKLG